jgi:hypothetical protein
MLLACSELHVRNRSFTGGITRGAMLLAFVIALSLSFSLCPGFAGPLAWDGRGVNPNSPTLAHKRTHKPARQLYTGALQSTQTDAPEYSPAWRKLKEAREAAEYEKLKRLMSICRGC